MNLYLAAISVGLFFLGRRLRRQGRRARRRRDYYLPSVYWPARLKRWGGRALYVIAALLILAALLGAYAEHAGQKRAAATKTVAFLFFSWR